MDVAEVLAMILENQLTLDQNIKAVYPSNSSNCLDTKTDELKALMMI